MKQLIIVAMLLLCILVASQLAYGQTDSVAGTVHNLASTSGNTIRASSASNGGDQVCIFCHTPHSTSTSPILWNRNDPGTSWQPYSSSTMNVTVGNPDGVSKMCLSCHDGVTAFNSLINNAGSGAGTAPTMTQADMGGYDSLGTNLTNDHPVSFQYSTSSGADGGIRAATGSKVINGGISLPLYGTSNYTLECGSCHNPHNQTNGTFLRVSNSGSQLCLTCHIK